MTTKTPGCFSSTGTERLADGSFVLHVSHQREWVYLQIITPDGNFRTRRYRPDQQVKVMG